MPTPVQGSFQTAVSAGSASGSAPAQFTDGLAVGCQAALRVTCAADASQTLSGGGKLLAYLWHPIGLFWSRNPDLDLAVTVSAGTSRAQTWPDIQALVSETGYRVAYVPSGVTVSGGTNVTVYLETSTVLR